MVRAISSAIEKRVFLNNSNAIGSWMAVITLSPSTADASHWHHPFSGAHTTLSGHKSPLLLTCVWLGKCSCVFYQGEGSALHVMLFLENLIRALLIFNGLRNRRCQRALLV